MAVDSLDRVVIGSFSNIGSNGAFALQGDGLPYPVQLGASKAILQYGLKLRENADLGQRLAALEAQMIGEA